MKISVGWTLIRREILPVVAAVAVFSFALHATGAGGRQVLQGHVPAAAQTATPVGPRDPAVKMNLAIGLPLRNPEALTNLLAQIYDPASAYYRHYLTPAQFTEQF